MIKLTDRLFNEKIQNIALSHYGIDKDSVKKHDGYCSYVFEGKKINEEVILKISHSSRIQKEQLASELDFTLHLKNHHVKICSPKTLGQDIFEINDDEGGVFYSYLYQKVTGLDFSEKEEKTEADLQEVGKILASLHKASLSFNFKDHSKRLSFIDRDFVNYKKIIPISEVSTHKCFDKIISNLNKLPKTKDNYGMTHGDSHDGNFLIQDNEITLIDFDDIEPGFFINDVAILMDHVCDDEDKRNKDWVEYVFINVMRGYNQVLKADSAIVAQLPLFMKFRWIMNHCLPQLIHGKNLLQNERLVKFHSRRLEMFGNDFKFYDYLYGFDYEGTYKKI